MVGKKLAGAVAIAAVAGLSVTVAATTGSAAEQPKAAHTSHGLGLNLAQAKAERNRDAKLGNPFAAKGKRAAAPASYDLSQYALSPGDQGQVGSCVTWATGYSAYGVLMNEGKISGAPMAPMYIYAQIAKGNDQGTTASVALPMLKDQGIDTKSDYTQGDFDYTDQPTSAERTNAAHYKLSTFTELPTSGSQVQSSIEDAISNGEPVPFGFQVHQSFMNLDSSTAGNYSYMPGDSSSDPIVGGHEVTIVAYNSQGVKVENSWGSSWGAGGFFTVPWKFFGTGDIEEIHAMGPVNHT